MSARSTPHSGAFTLIEVIIAMTLSSTLLLLLWSLFSTYSKLEERSSRTAVELQIVRSISQQLRSDLEHFAVLPVPANVVIETETSPSDDFDGQVQDGDTSDRDDNDGDDNDRDDNDDVETETDPGIQNEQVTPLEAARPTTPSNAFQDLRSVGRAGSVVTDGSQVTMGLAIEVDTNFEQDDIYQTTFNASLPAKTYLRGNATRLEFVTRLPYTVDVPVGQQILGAETRYGTHQLVLYEWRDERSLETMLREDPILNPAKWNPPPSLNPNDPVPVAMPLNPNENVGLIREMKSWLNVTRERQKEELKRQAGAAGLLVNGELPTADPRFANPMNNEPDSSGNFGASTLAGDSLSPDGSLQAWHPPPEFRHKKDHIPEVTRLQFRYFDGETWLLDWNDDDELPKAIEVAFDLDADAPAVRAREFQRVHELVQGGQSMQQVLPPQEIPEDETALAEIDPMATLNLDDPTAIVTEYRFVILLPKTSVGSNAAARGVADSVEPIVDEDGMELLDPGRTNSMDMDQQ